MDIWNTTKQLTGYKPGNGGIDSYGVDHSGFSIRDELEYQTARLDRENQLAESFAKHGIAEENYPQYGTNFWGSLPENNYGFGTSNISQNIQNVTNQLKNSGFNGANHGHKFGASNINHIPSGYGYSNYGLLLQPDVLTKQGTQYAQMVTPNTATDVNDSTILNQQDAIFDRVFNRTLQEEGGYENRATHIDTPTNMGFQQTTLDRFKSAHPDLAQGYPNNVRDLTYEQGKKIARKDYFDKYRIGEIQSQPLQETMFDSFFNHSPRAPAYWAQKAINQNTNTHVDEDGIFGSQTIRALNNLSPEDVNKVNNAILDMRQADYERERGSNINPNYGNYTTGLPNRFNRFRR